MERFYIEEITDCRQPKSFWHAINIPHDKPVYLSIKDQDQKSVFQAWCRDTVVARMLGVEKMGELYARDRHADH